MLDGGKAWRLFSIENSDETRSLNVTFFKLQLSNGLAVVNATSASTGGGAIDTSLFTSGSLSLITSFVTLRSNAALQSGASVTAVLGGAVTVSSATQFVAVFTRFLNNQVLASSAGLCGGGAVSLALGASFVAVKSAFAGNNVSSGCFGSVVLQQPSSFFKADCTAFAGLGGEGGQCGSAVYLQSAGASSDPTTFTALDLESFVYYAGSTGWTDGYWANGATLSVPGCASLNPFVFAGTANASAPVAAKCLPAHAARKASSTELGFAYSCAPVALGDCRVAFTFDPSVSCLPDSANRDFLNVASFSVRAFAVAEKSYLQCGLTTDPTIAANWNATVGGLNFFFASPRFPFLLGTLQPITPAPGYVTLFAAVPVWIQQLGEFRQKLSFSVLNCSGIADRVFALCAARESGKLFCDSSSFPEAIVSGNASSSA